MKTAQTTARTAREMFYFVDDVQRMLGYSRSKSYKIIKQLPGGPAHGQKAG